MLNLFANFDCNEFIAVFFIWNKMDRKIPSDFRRFCENDIKNLQTETDTMQKLHLMRRINAQMYAEGCKQ